MHRPRFFSIIVILILATGAVGQESDRERGITLFQKGIITEAIEVLRKAVSVDEKDEIAWRYLGACLVKQGLKAEARAAFTKGLGSKAAFDEYQKRYDRPLKVTQKSNAPYTEVARAMRITGNVTLAIEYRADGSIGFVFPITMLEGGLTESAVERAKEIRFEPAIRNGQPVTVVNKFVYGFSIY